MDFLTQEGRRDPYPFHRKFRSSTPVVYNPANDFWMIFDYQGVRRALTDTTIFSSDLSATAGQPTPNWIIFMDPPRHTKLRALIMHAFTPRMVANLEPRIRELARELLTPALARCKLDFATDFAIPLPLKVIAQMIGIPGEDWPRYRRWSDATLKLSETVSGRHADASVAAAYGQATREMAEYLAGLIEERRLTRPRTC